MKNALVATVFTIGISIFAIATGTVRAQEMPAPQSSSSENNLGGAAENTQANAPEAPELKGEPHSGGSVQEELEAIKERQRSNKPL